MDPLTRFATLQGGVFTLAQARLHHDRAHVRRQLRAQAWVPLRRGIYATKSVVDAAQADDRVWHMLQCAARVLATPADVVVSHQSAAVAQRIPMIDAYTGAPQLTLPRPEPGPPVHRNGLRSASLPSDQRTHGPVPITTLARTVADCARVLPREDALGMLDAALRGGISREAVLDVLATCTRWPGVEQAKELAQLADPRAESMLESVGRLWCHDAGLPPPEVQVRILRREDERFLGRVDLVWLAQRTVGELDGRLKYVVDDAKDKQPDEVLWREKLREDDLRDVGLEVARGYWSDRDDHGRRFVERVRRAMARGVGRTDAPAYRAVRDA